jgi:glycosyltransferase involved in cell wall biosynthesis
MPSRYPTPKPLVVVIGCDTFPPDINGAARFAERLAAGLQGRNHEVHVIAPSTNKRYGVYREVHAGVPIVVHRLKSYPVPQHKFLRYISPFGLRSRLMKLVKNIGPDVIHIQSHLMVGRYLSKVARELNIRLVATNHTMPENLVRYSLLMPKLFERLATRLVWADTGNVVSRAAVVTTPTRRAAEILNRATGIAGIYAISCGIDSRPFASAPPVSNQNPRALFLGRLDYEKHVHILIEAFSNINSHQRATLEIVGDGSERESLESWAQECGVADRVVFAGSIPDSELSAAYARASVFVMPSIAELQSIATMEAMASGRPVIAANAAALPHLVHDGENGFLFEPDNVEQLAQLLDRVFAMNDSDLQTLGDKSLHLIQSHDINRTLDAFEKIYRNQMIDLSDTVDNEPDYLLATRSIAIVKSSARSARDAAASARDSLSNIRSGVMERLNGVRGESLEKFDELKFEVSTRTARATRKIAKSIAKALNRFRNRDE